MEPERIWQFVTKPAWRPITSDDGPGYVLLGASALVLIALTVWTYVGSAQGTPRRIGILISLRLAALLLAIITAIRPAAAITEIPKLPSTLIVVIDSSESMSIKDEANSTRWEAIRRTLEKSGPLFEQLQNDQQVTIYQYHFSKDFDPDRDKLNPDVKPEGKRTEFGAMLSKLYDRHQGERLLRGLVILSDGRDNGTKPALPEASRWRGLGCPIYTFVVGQASTVTNEKDIGFTSISPDPSPAAIKSEVKVRAKLSAQGFEGIKARVILRFDGEQQAEREFELAKSTDNEIEITAKAPDKPGEVRVSLELVNPPLNQVTKLNDKIETYLTVTKEGVRVLVFGKLGPEMTDIRRALATDKRFDYVESLRASEAPGTAEDLVRYAIKDQRYDVIIIGDVGPRMLSSVRPGILKEIRDLVLEKGVGLMMTGGAHSLGGTAGIQGADGWARTPVAEVLPVTLPGAPPNEIKEPTTMEPTELGLRHYMMRLAADAGKNREAWTLLNSDYRKLQGYSPLGEPKLGSEVLARVNNAVSGPPLLVGMNIGKGGRSLAFGVSDSRFWTQPGPDPTSRFQTRDMHNRYWKQLVLWLAHQDEVEGSVYARPEYRRLVAGGQQTIRMGMKDKRGDEAPESDLRYQVLAPGETPDKARAKRAERDPKGGAKTSFEAREPGEYRVAVWGEGKDANGEPLTGDAIARYVVYPDISDEMLRPAADPDFLTSLENTANGTAIDTARRADRLPAFLEDMLANPPKMGAPKPKPYPEWKRDQQKWFLPLILVIFTAILGMEWALRRTWGMV